MTPLTERLDDVSPLTERLDDVEELVDVGVAREERISRQHLGRQTTDRPDVNRPGDKQQQRTGCRQTDVTTTFLGRQTAHRPDVNRPDDKQQQRTGCRQTDVTTKFLGRQTANRPDTCMNRPDDTQRIHRDVLVNFTSWWKEA